MGGGDGVVVVFRRGEGEERFFVIGGGGWGVGKGAEDGDGGEAEAEAGEGCAG